MWLAARGNHEPPPHDQPITEHQRYIREQLDYVGKELTVYNSYFLNGADDGNRILGSTPQTNTPASFLLPYKALGTCSRVLSFVSPLLSACLQHGSSHNICNELAVPVRCLCYAPPVHAHVVHLSPASRSCTVAEYVSTCSVRCFGESLYGFQSPY